MERWHILAGRQGRWTKEEDRQLVEMVQTAEREGRWVGGWVGARQIEENKVVRMRYCELGGWVDGWIDRSISFQTEQQKLNHPPTHPPQALPSAGRTSSPTSPTAQVRLSTPPPTHPPTHPTPPPSTVAHSNRLLLLYPLNPHTTQSNHPPTHPPILGKQARQRWLTLTNPAPSKRRRWTKGTSHPPTHPPTHPPQTPSTSFQPPRSPLPSHSTTHPPTHPPTRGR